MTRRPSGHVLHTRGPLARARPLQIVTVTVRPARAGGAVYAPNFRGDLVELPHGVWSTVPATPDVMLAIRNGALKVKKTKRPPSRGQ